MTSRSSQRTQASAADRTNARTIAARAVLFLALAAWMAPVRAQQRPPAASAETTAPQRQSSNPIVNRIQSFGFDTKPGIGYGGMVMLRIYPVVLFRDGTALTDVAGLGDPGGLDAFRAAHPDAFTRWRRSGSELQVIKSGEWKRLAFPTTYSTLPADFRLDGSFRALSGVGSLATGGTASVTVVNEYRFTNDGRVLRGGVAGSSAASGDMSVVTRAARPDQRGQYRISGITLQITYDDGSSEQRILVTDPSAPTTIWLDGIGYSQRKR